MPNNLAVYIHRPEEIQKFQAILGKSANSYVQSVIIAAADGKLAECTEQSVVRAALRAASLGLSCDPAQKEAQLIPRGKNVGTKDNPRWVKEASFEPHYLGLYKLAMRTGKYWVINVVPIMKGQEVKMGMDGLHFVYENGMKVDHFPVSRITAKNIDGVEGWLGYFKTTKGFEKTSYMSVDEIMEHAHTYSDAFKGSNSKYSLWDENSKHLGTMQMKTVLRDLLKWADTSGEAGAVLQAALEASDEIVDVDAEEVDDEYPPASEFQTELEPEPVPEPVKEKRLWTVAQKDALIKAGLAKNDFAAKGMLGLSTLPLDATIAEVVAWGEVYRSNRVDDKGKANLSAVEAAAIANEQAAP